MELIERFEKLGSFIFTALFVLFVAFGRSDSLPLVLYCATPIAFLLGVMHFFVGLFKLVIRRDGSFWYLRLEPYGQMVFGVALFLASLTPLLFAFLRR